MDSVNVKNFLLSPPIYLSIIFGISGIILFIILLKLFKNYEKTDDDTLKKTKHENVHITTNDKKKDVQSTKSKKKINENRQQSTQFSSPWLLTTLKGHTGALLNMDFSSNGKYLATCGEDRAVLLWDIKDLTQKDHRSLRVNIEFDHPTLVRWSPDSKAFIIQKHNENTIEVYKVEKKKEGGLGHASKALTFPKVHGTDVIGLGIASTGKFIMSCSNKTDMVVYDLKGQVLANVDTYLMSTTCAKISPCGRFIAASGFAPDVKVWEVIFNKIGEFQEVKRVFDLTGHTSGIYDLAFDADTSHVATVSKDGTWRLYDIKIDYKKGEDPHLKVSGKYLQLSSNALIALSPTADVVVIASGNTLSFYNGLNGKLDHTLTNVFAGNITSLLFDALGKYLLCGGDKHVKVFHNVTGYRCNVMNAREKLKQNQTSATKERLQALIRDSETFLATIEKK